jgi:hypothetical protein
MIPQTKILLTSHQPEEDKLLEKSSFLQDHGFNVTVLNANIDQLGDYNNWYIILWPDASCAATLTVNHTTYFLELVKKKKRISLVCPKKPLGLLSEVEWYSSWDNFTIRNFV